MKKGPLSNKEKEFIIENRNDFSVDNLCKKMDRSVSIVNKYISTLTSANKKPSRASDLLARNEDRGVVVMTEASSMESDKRLKKKKQPAKYRQIIHKIKGD